MTGSNWNRKLILKTHARVQSCSDLVPGGNRPYLGPYCVFSFREVCEYLFLSSVSEDKSTDNCCIKDNKMGWFRGQGSWANSSLGSQDWHTKITRFKSDAVRASWNALAKSFSLISCSIRSWNQHRMKGWKHETTHWSNCRMIMGSVQPTCIFLCCAARLLESSANAVCSIKTFDTSFCIVSWRLLFKSSCSCVSNELWSLNEKSDSNVSVLYCIHIAFPQKS